MNGTPYPAVNAGHYEGHTRVVSLGATVYFDGLIGPKRHGAVKAKEPEPPPPPAEPQSAGSEGG